MQQHYQVDSQFGEYIMHGTRSYLMKRMNDAGEDVKSWDEALDVLDAYGHEVEKCDEE